MSILTRWLLIPPVNARLIGRYRDYRRHGASAFSATLGCFWMIPPGFLFRWSTRAGSVFAQNIKPVSAYQRLASASAGPGPLSHSNMLVIDRCIAQRNAETAQAGIFRSAKYSWTLPSMDERAA